MISDRNLNIASLIPVSQTVIGLGSAAKHAGYAARDLTRATVAKLAGYFFDNEAMRVEAGLHQQRLVASVKLIGEGVVTALPVIGTAYVAKNRFGYNAGDAWSLLPIVSTATGALTILSNTLKAVREAAILAKFNVIDRTVNYVKNGKDQGVYDARSKEISDASAVVIKELLNDGKFVGVGVIRAIPIVGTVFTLYKHPASPAVTL